MMCRRGVGKGTRREARLRAAERNHRPKTKSGKLRWLLTCSEGEIRRPRRRPNRRESGEQEDVTTERSASKSCQEMWRSRRDEGKQAGRSEYRERVMERRRRGEEESAQGKQEDGGWSRDGEGGGDVCEESHTGNKEKTPRARFNRSLVSRRCLHTGEGAEPAAGGLRSIHRRSHRLEEHERKDTHTHTCTQTHAQTAARLHEQCRIIEITQFGSSIFTKSTRTATQESLRRIL